MRYMATQLCSNWPQSLVLAGYLEKLRAVEGEAVLSGRRVLELGSGCGVAGIAAALLGVLFSRVLFSCSCS